MELINEPRQCVVNGACALFHGWAEMEKPNIEGGRQVGRWKNTVAVIEYQNGSVELVAPGKIRFMDGYEMFSRYDWSEVDAQ